MQKLINHLEEAQLNKSTKTILRLGYWKNPHRNYITLITLAHDKHLLDTAEILTYLGSQTHKHFDTFINPAEAHQYLTFFREVKHRFRSDLRHHILLITHFTQTTKCNDLHIAKAFNVSSKFVREIRDSFEIFKIHNIHLWREDRGNF